MKSKNFIHSTADVSTDAKLGSNNKIWHQSQIREGATIGDGCNFGKCVYIDKNVKIGNGVKIENQVSIYQGVTIEDNVFIGPHVSFTNDLYPRSFNKSWKIVPTLVKNGASIGANSTILCGVTIGNYAMIGIGSVVTRDVPSNGLVYGNPAKLRGFVCKCGEKPLKLRDESNFVFMKCKKCGEVTKIDKNLFNSVV